MTDAAEYRMSDGVLQAIRTKVFELPTSGSAFAALGTAGPHLQWLADRLAEAQSFDELLAIAGSVALAVHENALKAITFEDGHALEFELTFIGWSDDRDRAEAWSLCTHAQPEHGEPWDGYVPYLPASIYPVMLRPGLGSPAEAMNVLGRDREWETPEEFFAINVNDAALLLLEAQRDLRLTQGQLHDVHMVGGFVELTTATKHGITRKILREWFDKVGEPIQPFLERARSHERSLPLKVPDRLVS